LAHFIVLMGASPYDPHNQGLSLWTPLGLLRHQDHLPPTYVTVWGESIVCRKASLAEKTLEFCYWNCKFWCKSICIRKISWASKSEGERLLVPFDSATG